MTTQTTKTSTTRTKKPRKRPEYYINPQELYAEVLVSKEAGQMTDKLVRMLQLLTLKYSKKGNLANYSYTEDMQAFAMMMLVKTWTAFNPEKSSNAFAFYTQCVKNSFRQFLNDEKRQRTIRDAYAVEYGLTPSYNYQLEYAENNRAGRAHDEEDFDHTH